MILRALMILGAFLCVWVAYLLAVTLIVAWRRQVWVGDWDWATWRNKRADGCQKVAGPAVYVHLFLIVPVYSGQTVNMRARMRTEGHMIIALFFTHWLAIGCQEHELDTTERFLIRWFPWTRWLKFNLTRGNAG